MDVYWTAPGGDDLRIAELDTPHPHLQLLDAGRWRDCPPKQYPRSLFGLAVSLLGVLADLKMLDSPAVVDCGIQTDEP